MVGVHVGYVDTRMAAHASESKMRPEDLVRAVYDAVEAGEYEVIADEGPDREAFPRLRSALSGQVGERPGEVYHKILEPLGTPRRTYSGDYLAYSGVAALRVMHLGFHSP